LKRWIKRVTLGLLGQVVALAVTGALYQLAGTAIDSRKYPPPGKSVDVGGYRLHLYCTGAGSPAVLLDTANTGWSLYWSTVQPEERDTQLHRY
jgi:hypothetical protein